MQSLLGPQKEMHMSTSEIVILVSSQKLMNINRHWWQLISCQNKYLKTVIWIMLGSAFLFISCKRGLGWIFQIYTSTIYTSEVRWNKILPENFFADCNGISFKSVLTCLLYKIGSDNNNFSIYGKYKRSPIASGVDGFYYRKFLKWKKNHIMLS